MNRISDRYASAVHSGNLSSEPETTCSDSDVLGAAGIASKYRPLAIALLRLFSGDNRAGREIVGILAQMLVSKAWSTQVVISQLEAEDIGRAVLAWHRDGVCRHCGGHGYELVVGAPALSGHACGVCHGTGRLPFERQFRQDRIELALWLRERIEREQAFAGAEAMKALAPRLEL